MTMVLMIGANIQVFEIMEKSVFSEQSTGSVAHEETLRSDLKMMRCFSPMRALHIANDDFHPPRVAAPMETRATRSSPNHFHLDIQGLSVPYNSFHVLESLLRSMLVMMKEAISLRIDFSIDGV